MLEKYEVVKAFFHGFDYQPFFTAETKDDMTIMMEAMEHILKQEKGKDRYLKAIRPTAQSLRTFYPQ